MISDLFAIEVCGTMQNLLDKRSRYAPSLHSLLVCCPAPWLNRPVPDYGSVPRWQLTGLLEQPADHPLILPVRDMRVLYALKPRQFQDFAEHHIAHAHELFAPIDILTTPSGWRDPALRQFLARAARRANFWESSLPERAQGEFASEADASQADAAGPSPSQPRHAATEEPFNIGRLIGRPRREAAEIMGFGDLVGSDGRLKPRQPRNAGRLSPGTRELAAQVA